jgi:hypothetical protein
MPADPERARLVDQGPAYVAYTSGYLVRAGSDIGSVADVDRPGIRVGCIEGTGTARVVAKELKRATLTKFAQAETAAELIGKGQLDALAMGTEAVKDLSRKLPGTRYSMKRSIRRAWSWWYRKVEPRLATGLLVSSKTPRRTAPCDEPSTAAASPRKRWRHNNSFAASENKPA